VTLLPGVHRAVEATVIGPEPADAMPFKVSATACADGRKEAVNLHLLAIPIIRLFDHARTHGINPGDFPAAGRSCECDAPESSTGPLRVPNPLARPGLLRPAP
jgi:hypothetical protein